MANETQGDAGPLGLWLSEREAELMVVALELLETVLRHGVVAESGVCRLPPDDLEAAGAMHSRLVRAIEDELPPASAASEHPPAPEDAPTIGQIVQGAFTLAYLLRSHEYNVGDPLEDEDHAVRLAIEERLRAFDARGLGPLPVLNRRPERADG